MSHFYATIHGNRSQATRMGTPRSGMHSNTAGWKGCISVNIGESKGKDFYTVSLTPWGGSGGQSRVIAEGPLDANADEFITRGAAMGSRDLEMLKVLKMVAQQFALTETANMPDWLEEVEKVIAKVGN